MLELWTDKEIEWDNAAYDRTQHEAERIKQGFSRYDFWSFDTYIAAVIANYAEYAMENGLGYPANVVNEHEYRQILEKIRVGFANYAEHKFDLEYDDALFKEAMDLFKEYFYDFWD